MLVRRADMSTANRRVTVYLKPEYHRALRIKAAETEYSVSDLVNSAVKQALLEDAVDIEAFDKRAEEPVLVFEEVVKTLKRDGKL